MYGTILTRSRRIRVAANDDDVCSAKGTYNIIYTTNVNKSVKTYD